MSAQHSLAASTHVALRFRQAGWQGGMVTVNWYSANSADCPTGLKLQA
jgi:hypothetical protein